MFRYLFHTVNLFLLYTSPYVSALYRKITAIVLLYHNVNKTCLWISSDIIIRGPARRCYSTNICKAMHHLRPCHSLYESHNAQWIPPLPPANVNYHISPWHLPVMANMSYVKSVSLWWRWTGGVLMGAMHNKACLLIRQLRLEHISIKT